VYRKDVAEIVGAALPGDRVRAGRTVPLRVSLRPYAGREYVDIVPITVPRSLAGRTVKLEVASGAEVKPDLPRPETLRGLMDNLATTFSAASLVVSIGTTDGGVSLRGCLIPGLPPSALDTLKPAHQSRRAEPYRMAERTVFPSARLVKGKQELTLRVEDENAGNGR
jgi:hypothetical protein